jgi:hypothetical protein
LLGKLSQREIDGATGRRFRDQHEWCWNVAPLIVPTGEVLDEVQLDGTWFKACKRTLLIAIDAKKQEVIAWRWAKRERAEDWIALMDTIPAPRVVVVDGGSGLASALATAWPTTRVQRCLVHVQRDAVGHLSRNPRTHAGRTLLQIVWGLTKITTVDEATQWAVHLHEWHQLYEGFINERTYAADNIVRPEWAKRNSPWWYTHEKVRRAYYTLAGPLKRGLLFTFLDPNLTELQISSTTNRIEGGVNAPIKRLLRDHRGLTGPRQQRAAEWWCYTHSPAPRKPHELIRPHHWQPAIDTTDEPLGIIQYGTAVTTDYKDFEGVHVRKGLAGRSN